MNKEKLEEKLIKIGIKLGYKDSLINLVQKFVKEYINYFSKKVINKLDFAHIETNVATRLNLENNQRFNEEEKKLLNFSDITRITLNNKIYTEINLKGYVTKLVIDNNEQLLMPPIHLIELINYLEFTKGLKINQKLIKKHQEEIYLKSLIYNYSYILINEMIQEEMDSVRAGMFKNAYFDIMMIYSETLDQNLYR